jgi:hypothetical protein
MRSPPDSTDLGHPMVAALVGSRVCWHSRVIESRVFLVAL